MNILSEIIAFKVREVAENLRHTSIKALETSLFFDRETIPFSDYILNPEKTGIIAEFKRKSPSKGIINNESDIQQVTSGYCIHGASALSVLTDREFFGGSGKDLSLVRQISQIPVLRKDFIIDEYQIVEAKALGADAILLIAAALKNKSLRELARFAVSLDLQVLLEVHNKKEIDSLNEFVTVIGVNNRNLHSFRVDTNVSIEMAALIPEQFIKISESGLTTPSIVKELRNAGYNGFLMGEIFMRQSDPAAAFSDFVNELFPGDDKN